jgi:hypothetical protein
MSTLAREQYMYTEWFFLPLPPVFFVFHWMGWGEWGDSAWDREGEGWVEE